MRRPLSEREKELLRAEAAAFENQDGEERDICSNNHGGNAESEDAFNADGAKEARAALRARVFAYIATCDLRKASADEVEIAFGGMHQSISPRMTELKARGLIVATGERVKTRLGRFAMRYRVATPEELRDFLSSDKGAEFTRTDEEPLNGEYFEGSQNE